MSVPNDEMRIGFTLHTPTFDKLPSLAKRLGVAPCQHADLMIQYGNGEQYDVFELLHAFLDRLDQRL